ncbi:MAG: hypothetical protein M1828_000478 [Chrysothrix sp. TS-e1954]|nr:MAG: hypothetical protein M1828_000478 [Chrysothrix sp. TS-e1954]
MSTNASIAQSTDINNIDYNAPFTFQEPSDSWKKKQADKGRNSNRLSSATLPDADLRGKWIIVSGANNGIGREACLKFASWGASIILGCREPPKHEQHPTAAVEECRTAARKAGHEKSEFEWWHLDMTDLSTVESFAQKWLESGRGLDILCNNAGVGTSPGWDNVVKTKDGFEWVHQINFLSHVLITLRLLPALAKAALPRIVCTTSCFHFLGHPALDNFNGEHPVGPNNGGGFYKNNKLWLQTWLTELQHRLLQHDQYRRITVHGVHPGFVNSGIWTLNKNKSWTESLLKTLAWLFAISPQQGSFAILNAATTIEAGPDPEVQGVGPVGGKGGGKYWNRVWEAEPMPHTRDRDYRLRVWRKVNDELQLDKKGLLDVLGVYSNDNSSK